MFEFCRLYCAHVELHAPFPFDGLLFSHIHRNCRQEFEHANRNAAFFNHYNSEDRHVPTQMTITPFTADKLHVHLFNILASVRLQFNTLITFFAMLSDGFFLRFFRLGTRLVDTQGRCPTIKMEALSSTTSLRAGCQSVSKGASITFVIHNTRDISTKM